MSFLNTFNSISDRLLFCQFIGIIWIFLFDWSPDSTPLFKAIKLFCNTSGFLFLILWCFSNSAIYFAGWISIVVFQIIIYFISLIKDFDTLIKSRDQYKEMATTEKMEKQEIQKLLDQYKSENERYESERKRYENEKERFEINSRAIFTALTLSAEKSDEKVKKYKKEIEELKKSREKFPFPTSNMKLFE